MPQCAIEIPYERLASFCRSHDIIEVAIFGSALRDDFGPNSDIDLLVTFHPAAYRNLLNEAGMELELEDIFGRPVDMVSRDSVENSDNPYRKRAILESAVTVYDGKG